MNEKLNRQILRAIHDGPLSVDELKKIINTSRNAIVDALFEMESLGMIYSVLNPGTNCAEYHIINASKTPATPVQSPSSIKLMAISKPQHIEKKSTSATKCGDFGVDDTAKLSFKGKVLKLFTDNPDQRYSFTEVYGAIQGASEGSLRALLHKLVKENEIGMIKDGCNKYMSIAQFSALVALEPAVPELAVSEPVEPEPVEPESAEPEPVEPEPNVGQVAAPTNTLPPESSEMPTQEKTLSQPVKAARNKPFTPNPTRGYEVQKGRVKIFLDRRACSRTVTLSIPDLKELLHAAEKAV